MESSVDDQSAAPDLETALATLRTQADQGNADAQFSLGLHYGSATGNDLDFVQAARWYTKAAEQDHSLAQFNLSVMFTRGQGMPHDDAAAAAWMRKAAEGGDAGGQHLLGVRCHRASVDPLQAGATESRIEAFQWLKLASEQGYQDSLTAWQRLTVTMSRAEVEAGNQRVAAFVVRQNTSPLPQ